MSSVIRFKFKSSSANNGRRWDTVHFDGPSLSVMDLKRSIIGQKKLKTQKQEFDLVITNDQTNEEYLNDAYLIPKNTSVTVRRVPTVRAQNMTIRIKSENPSDDGSEASGPPLVEKLKAVAEASLNLHHNRVRLARLEEDSNQPPPQHYVCYKCNVAGHWIKNCPTNANHVPKGLFPERAKYPSSQLQLSVEEENLMAGGTVFFDGGDGENKIFLNKPDEKSFWREIAKMKPNLPVKEPPNRALLCPLCDDYFRHAVFVACCSRSYCEACITSHLSKDPFCPSCKQKADPRQLVPNSQMQNRVNEVLNKKEDPKPLKTEPIPNGPEEPPPSEVAVEQQEIAAKPPRKPRAETAVQSVYNQPVDLAAQAQVQYPIMERVICLHCGLSGHVNGQCPFLMTAEHLVEVVGGPAGRGMLFRRADPFAIIPEATRPLVSIVQNTGLPHELLQQAVVRRDNKKQASPRHQRDARSRSHSSRSRSSNRRSRSPSYYSSRSRSPSKKRARSSSANRRSLSKSNSKRKRKSKDKHKHSRKNSKRDEREEDRPSKNVKSEREERSSKQKEKRKEKRKKKNERRSADEDGHISA